MEFMLKMNLTEGVVLRDIVRDKLKSLDDEIIKTDTKDPNRLELQRVFGVLESFSRRLN